MTAAVSVVVTAFDAQSFIEEAVCSALDQTVTPTEIVVVDDGSTDDTATLAEALGPTVTVLRRTHAGIGPSRNAGLAAVHTPLVALLDADDVWLPTKLERQLAVFADDASCEAVFTWFDEFADVDHPPAPGTRTPRVAQSGALTSGALLRRELIERLGPFPGGPNADWVAWWAHARALGVVARTVPEVLYRRRIHGANNSFVNGEQGRELLAVARRHLDEVRARRSGGPT
jgi:glycosyltransferase involved in cell wall biosynthesis